MRTERNGEASQGRMGPSTERVPFREVYGYPKAREVVLSCSFIQVDGKRRFIQEIQDPKSKEPWGS